MSNSNSGRSRALLYIVLIVAGIAAGGAGVYYLTPGGQRGGATVAESPAKAQTTAVRRVKYWQAPMDPTYIRNEPGKSPMGMDLVPVYEDAAAAPEPGTVVIDPVTIQNIGVRTERAATRTLTKTVRTVGRVDYDEKMVHHVNTKIEGWIEKLYVDFTGQEVEKDDYLLEIYSPKLVATQEEYLLARSYQETGAPGAGSVLELAKKRLELWDVPAHQIAELEATGVIKKTIHIHSPARGIVVDKPVQEGMFVKPGVKLYTIADLSRVWVYADVYEYEMSWVHTGQEAEMTLAAYPGRVFRGRVSFINPFMEPRTRTVKVRIEFDNPGGALKPDMFANVTLQSRSAAASVVVPTEAVLLSGERSVVIVSRGEGRFSPREVRLGAEAEGYYEVAEGIAEGELVVTSAHFLIDSESRLKEAIAKMLDVEREDAGSAPMPETDRVGEEMDHSGMDHPEMNGMGHMDHSGMDHQGMDGMNHSGMDHSGMNGMGHGGDAMQHDHMGHQGMDGMEEPRMEEMDHSGMDHPEMNGMGHMDHSGMDGMDHTGMEIMDREGGGATEDGHMDHTGMGGMDHSGMEGMDR